MKQLKEYTIPFVGLKQGVHQFDYKIDNTFFAHFEYDEFNASDIKVALAFEKKATMLELNFIAKGTININCDLTNEPFDMPLDNELFLVVKFGEEFNNENEELLIIPHGEYEINIQQYIYELIVLAVPHKRVHPGVEDGTLESDILEKLEELSPKEKTLENNNDETDPRWDKLRKISKTRRDKRRTHYKATVPQIATDPTTGEAHLYHRAHWFEGKLYYRGQVVIDNTEEVA